jgi:L-threonylcarbamoyladenylate synthase
MLTTPTPVSPDSVADCVAHLRSGALAIIPTDTVYGIVADASNEGAVRALYAAKGKSETAPLQLLFAPDMASIAKFADLGVDARRLIEALGPGGWTVIARAVPGWESPALAGGSTVGVRIPDAPVVWAIVSALGNPLAASSANRHGAASSTTCAQAISEVGAYCAIALDAGTAPAGLDSTVVDCAIDGHARILREGAIDRHTVARILSLSDIPVLRSVRT